MRTYSTARAPTNAHAHLWLACHRPGAALPSASLTSPHITSIPHARTVPRPAPPRVQLVHKAAPLSTRVPLSTQVPLSIPMRGCARACSSYIRLLRPLGKRSGLGGFGYWGQWIQVRTEYPWVPRAPLSTPSTLEYPDVWVRPRFSARACVCACAWASVCALVSAFECVGGSERVCVCMCTCVRVFACACDECYRGTISMGVTGAGAEDRRRFHRGRDVPGRQSGTLLLPQIHGRRFGREQPQSVNSKRRWRAARLGAARLGYVLVVGGCICGPVVLAGTLHARTPAAGGGSRKSASAAGGWARSSCRTGS